MTAIAVMYGLASAYLAALGLLMLAAPGTVSITAGAPLLFGLELAGPYMFLLVAGMGALLAWGLWRMNRWARWGAIAAALAGVVMLVPSVSAAAISIQPLSLLRGGLGVIVRVAVVWYLVQEPVAECF